MRELFIGVIPMRRAVDAKEIADAAVFLASDQARSINGQTLAIDGGSLTRGYPALLTGLKKHSIMIDAGRYTSGRIASPIFRRRSRAWSFAVSNVRRFEDLLALSKLLFLARRLAWSHRGP